jgi:hypothetical protein
VYFASKGCSRVHEVMFQPGKTSSTDVGDG